MSRYFVRALCAGVAAFALATGLAAASPDKPVIGIVVKIGGIPWFNAMDAGIKKRAEQLGVKAFMVGPTSADPALQVRAIEDLIAQHVDVIGVVPNDAEVLEPVLARARAAGIKVITHESPKQKNTDWDFELASVKGFGEAYAKRMATALGGKGEYAVPPDSATFSLEVAAAPPGFKLLDALWPATFPSGEGSDLAGAQGLHLGGGKAADLRDSQDRHILGAQGRDPGGGECSKRRRADINNVLRGDVGNLSRQQPVHLAGAECVGVRSRQRCDLRGRQSLNLGDRQRGDDGAHDFPLDNSRRLPAITVTSNSKPE